VCPVWWSQIRSPRKAGGLRGDSFISAECSTGATFSPSRVASPEALFEKDYARLVRALGVAIGDQEEARDAVQEAFVQAWQNWERIGGYDDPAGWVRRVAVNRLLNHRRTLLRRGQALVRLGSPQAHVAPPTEERLLLSQAFAHLSARQRAALALRYVAGYSNSEIASALGVSEGTVSQHLHRGKESLRKLLEDER
jgi:RNA polymerase sigma-70 factor (ECF subfamily)